MKYILEVSDTNGEKIGRDAGYLMLSDSIIPIPVVGDEIMVAGAGRVSVVNRLYSYYGDEPGDKTTAHVQLFCNILSAESFA